MNHRESIWTKLQRGQAMLEYWPTLPVAITLLVISGGMTLWLRGAFMRTTEGLNRAGLSGEICDTTEDTPVVTDLGGHTIETSSIVYDPDDDTTTVTFTVTSSGEHDISHWLLGLPEDVAAKILDSSEPYENWQQDPTTGVWGIKFDTEYGGGGGGGNGGPKGGPKKSLSSHVIRGRAINFQFQEGESTTVTTGEVSAWRDVTLVFSGQYEYDSTVVVIKTSTESFEGTISAPSSAVTTEDSSELVSVDSLYEGCGS
jgi:hypothetical protein